MTLRRGYYGRSLRDTSMETTNWLLAIIAVELLLVLLSLMVIGLR